MGLFKRILTFLLSFLLTIESHGFSFFILNSSFADEFDKAREDCINKKSKVWNPALNRCMTRKESFEDRQSFKSCAVYKDDYEKQRECFDQNAQEMVGDLEPKKKGLAEMQKTAEALGYIQMLLEMIAKEGANNKCMSSKVMALAGIAGMGVDIYLTFFVEDELHELQDKYAKKITKKKQIEKGEYETQIEAFNYLQKEQETLISIDEKKIIAYGLMTGLNGVAMLLAIYESTPFGAAGACTGEAPPSEGTEIPDEKLADTGKGKAPDVEVSPDVEGTGGGPGKTEIPEGGGPGKTDITDGGGPGKTDIPEGGGPKGGEPPSGKKGKFKEVATDIKEKQKVVSAFEGGETPPGGGGKTKFKEVSTDVKTKKKVIGAFETAGDYAKDSLKDIGPLKPPGGPPRPPKRPSILDNPPGDVPSPPKPPGDPPKRPSSVADLGDQPQRPKKPSILENPPGDVAPPPKAPDPPKPPEPPGDPPRNPGDPGKAPSKPSDIPPKNPGDTPPPGPSGKAPPDPGAPPKDFDLEGPGATKIADAESLKPPKKPEPPEGMKIDRDGNWVQANIESISKPKKDVAQMTDADIDGLDLDRKDKQKMKELRTKKEKNLAEIKGKEKRLGKDFRGRDQMEAEIKTYDKNSYNLQDQSQRREVGRTQHKIETYKKDLAKWEVDDANFQKKQARRGAIDDYKAKKTEYDNYQKQKIDFENYKKQKAEFDNYQKQKADFDSYSQRKTDFENYDSDSVAWKRKNEKYQTDLESFNQKQQKYDSDLEQYNKDYDNWQNQKSTKDTGDADFEAAKKQYDDDLAKYEVDNEEWVKQKKKAELDRANYNMNKAKYDADMETYQKDFDNWKTKDTGNLEFENSKKKYESDLAKYDAEMDAWTVKNKKYELDKANYAKRKTEIEAIKTGEGIPETKPKKSFKETATEVKDKKKVLDAFEGGPEKPVTPETPKKKGFKEAATEIKEEKKVLDAFKKGEPEVTPAKPKKSFKEVATEIKEEKKVIDAFEKGKAPEPEKPKSAWESFKEGASKFFNWLKGSPVYKGAKMGTKVIHNKTMFYKGGKEVEFCDKDLEEDCEEEIIQVDEEGNQVPEESDEREKSKAKENPNESYRKIKHIDFNDPNEILSAFSNHTFEDQGLENIEDALILEKEWKNKVSGGVQSPSIDEYKKMKESGLFGKNPTMANILFNIFISYRKINFAESLFPIAKAQTSSTSTVGSTPKDTFMEETDDEEDAANKKKRQEQKGKDAGIMLGTAAGGMIAGALVSAGLDKLTSFKGALGKLGKVVDKVRVFFGTSPGIAVLAGMSTLINGLTLGFVVEEKKSFEENVKKIKEIKEKFEEDLADFCPKKDDREDQSKPACYCYKAGGIRNPLRKNSDICKSYWSRFDASFYVGAGDYEFKGEKEIKGCVGIKGNYDFDCSCRRYKDRASGSNACMKVNNSFDGIGNIGTSNSVGVLTTYGNDIASDPATIHRLDGDAVGRNAVKLKKAADQALVAFNKQRVASGEKPFTVEPKDLENFTNKVLGMPESRPAMLALQEAKSTPARPPLTIPKDLKLKEEKKMDLSKITYEPAKKKKEEKKEEAKAKAPDWDFLAEEKKEKEDLAFMDKAFDYQKGVEKKEIIEKEDVSIFQVISNRYINTGLKLLFKEDKK